MSYTTNNITNLEFLQALAAADRSYAGGDRSYDFQNKYLSGYKSIYTNSLPLDRGENSEFTKVGNDYYFNNKGVGASAIVLYNAKLNKYIIAFTGTDHLLQDALYYKDAVVTKKYIYAYNSLLKWIIKQPGIESAEAIFTGHSLGAAAVNNMVDSTWAKIFAHSKYIGFESPQKSNNKLVFNFGIENDKVYSTFSWDNKGYEKYSTTNIFTGDSLSISPKNLEDHSLSYIIPVVDSIFGKDSKKNIGFDLFDSLGKDAYIILVKSGFADYSYSDDRHPEGFIGKPANGYWTIFGKDTDDNIRGTKFNDIIFGLKGDDWLNGGRGGNDYLISGEGNDKISTQQGINFINTGPGQDIVYSGGTNDKIFFGQPDEPIKLSFSKAIDDNAIISNDGDTFYNVEGFLFSKRDDTVFVGDNVASKFETFAGNDNIYISGPSYVEAGDGDDKFFISDKGAVLDGGKGRDSFLIANFKSPEEYGSINKVQINNFQSKIDKIDLTKVDARPDLAGFQKLHFIGFFEHDSKTSFKASEAGTVCILQSDVFNCYNVCINTDKDMMTDMLIVSYNKISEFDLII